MTEPNWALQKRNLETLLSSKWGWIPIKTDEKVDKDLAPNIDGMLIERVKCPKCGQEYKFIQKYYSDRHMIMCPGEEK